MSPPSPAHALAFESAVRAHGAGLLAFCASRVGPDEAEDCFQSAMLAALRAWGTLRDPEAVRGWLFSIAARTAIDHHRARARRPAPVDDIAALAGAADDPDPADPSLWRRVEALAPARRRALVLRFVDDLSHAQVGAALGTSEAAARRAVHDALAVLRSELT
ncbi:MAG: sigma-70 family RNA polymerase sigma factor [Miltoncostaeaceae bacterium]